MSKRSAHTRYVVSCAALALLVALPIITAWVLYEQSVQEHTSAKATATAAQTASPLAPASVSQIADAAPSGPGPLLMAWLVWLQPWTIPVWSAGVVVFSSRFLWSCSQVSSFRRHGEPAGDAVLMVIAGLARRMGVTCPVRALVSSLVDGPTVMGWLRPVILVPAASIFGLTPQQLEAVLAHEVAHIRRYDYLVNVLQMLAETLLFYHPAVWWTSARIRHERELCCDDLAVDSCGDALCYARALTQLERLRMATPAMALGSTRGSLSYRIQRLVGRAPQEHGISTLSAVVAFVLASACVALPIYRSRAQAESRTGGSARTTDQLTLAEVFRENDVAHNEGYVSVDVGGATVDREGVEDNRRDRSKQAILVIEVKLDGDGDVADARVVSGPDELRRAALNSVRGWHFDVNNGSTRQITITYHPVSPEGTKPSRTEEQSAQRATDTPLYPHLRSADEPVYPSVARAAQIAGIVQVKVTVRNGKVVEMVKSFGPPIPILHFATIQNIRSWKFDPSVNARFVTRFTYQIDKRQAQDTKIDAQLPRQATITVP